MTYASYYSTDELVIAGQNEMDDYMTREERFLRSSSRLSQEIIMIIGRDETRRDEERRDEERRDETRRDETRRGERDETRRDETRRDETRRDEERRDEERRDETRRDETRRDRETERERISIINRVWSVARSDR